MRLHSAAEGETRLINTSAEHKIIQYSSHLFLAIDPPRADLRSIDSFTKHNYSSARFTQADLRGLELPLTPTGNYTP